MYPFKGCSAYSQIPGTFAHFHINDFNKKIDLDFAPFFLDKNLQMRTGRLMGSFIMKTTPFVKTKGPLKNNFTFWKPIHPVRQSCENTTYT